MEMKRGARGVTSTLSSIFPTRVQSAEACCAPVMDSSYTHDMIDGNWLSLLCECENPGTAYNHQLSEMQEASVPFLLFVRTKDYVGGGGR